MTATSTHSMHSAPGADRNGIWHLLLIVMVSGAYEALFIHHGIAWLFDEGWPLYAAMKLHLGGVLYGDVFFPFPPGHLLPAWIAYALDPPGVILARWIYAGLNVLLCVAIYLLGLRIMSPRFALLASLMLAVAAPRSHLAHLLFGYRFLVFSVLALLAFDARLRTGDRRWMLAAGLAAGVALYFRLTPAFAVSCGIAISSLTVGAGWRDWLRDWAAYGIGILVVMIPTLAWFAGSVGLEVFWQESVLRILPLQAMQSKPVPELSMPVVWNRVQLYRGFVSIQYWLYPLVYFGYSIVLVRNGWRSRQEGGRFGQSLLLAIVIWGAIYILRTLGRSDEHHLTSALPPACLMLAHLASVGFGRLSGAAGSAGTRRAWWERLTCLVVLGIWIVLQGSDLFLSRDFRGVQPLQSLNGEVSIKLAAKARAIDRTVEGIRERTAPGDVILDLTHSPLLYVLADRAGPGYSDVVSPGVFADPKSERAFVRRLEKAPPKLVLWPRKPFDNMPERSLGATAPLLTAWVRRHYEIQEDWTGRDLLLLPKRGVGRGMRARP